MAGKGISDKNILSRWLACQHAVTVLAADATAGAAAGCVNSTCRRHLSRDLSNQFIDLCSLSNTILEGSCSILASLLAYLSPVSWVYIQQPTILAKMIR